jgi:hypothetical protein
MEEKPERTYLTRRSRIELADIRTIILRSYQFHSHLQRERGTLKNESKMNVWKHDELITRALLSRLIISDETLVNWITRRKAGRGAPR